MKKSYLILLLIVLSIISIFLGVKEISLSNIFRLNEEEVRIIVLSRVPRLVSIIVAGMSMSISGLIIQQISHNKFVSPTTAATVDSAKLGILVSLILFTSSNVFIKMTIAFIFALAGTFLFMEILKRVKFKNTIFIPLIGLMLGNIIDAVTTFIAYKYDLIQNISSWLQGDFSMIIKGRYELLYISVPFLVISFLYASKFTVAGMGEDFSSSLGLDYRKVVNIGIIIVSLISSIVLITVGRIPFLGLIVPNLVKIFQGDNMEKNIGYTALLGAVFLLICDILGRIIIYPYEISISLTVGVIGNFIFLYLILRREHNV